MFKLFILTLLVVSLFPSCSNPQYLPSTNIANGGLFDVWGSSSTDVFTVGNEGIILHFNGVNWSYMPSSTNNPLYAVWGSSKDDVFAVGDAGTILHYDGKSWISMTRSLSE